MLKNTAIGIAIGILVMGGVWGLVHIMGDTATNSSTAKGNTKVAPCDQKNPATPIERMHIEA